MADAQRIHPSPDPESLNHHHAPPSPLPSAPLIPPSTVKSDKPYPIPAYPQPLPPPRRHRRCRICRCLCCTFCTLLVLIILFVGIFAAVLFLGFHPKIPHYSIDGIRVASLTTTGSALSVTFNVNVTARNNNKKIGIYYLSGSSLSVLYEDTELCQGSLPVFYQGHRNTTVMQVSLSGETSNATALASDLLAAQQSSGGIPLVIKGKVPVKIKMGKLKLMKIRFKATCELLVDSLTANNQIRITSSHCKIRLNRIFGINF